MLLCCFYVVKTNWGMISSHIFSTRKDKGNNNCCALNTLTNLKQKSDKNKNKNNIFVRFLFLFLSKLNNNNHGCLKNNNEGNNHDCCCFYLVKTKEGQP